MLGVVEFEGSVEVNIRPALDLAPLGTEQDILEVQLDVVANVWHLTVSCSSRSNLLSQVE